jgi:hypothetical protein
MSKPVGMVVRPVGEFMSTEVISEVHLSLDDLEDPEWLFENSPAENPKLPILTFGGPIAHFERIKKLLCSLRAANAPALLFIERPNPPPELSELVPILEFLKSWDQLTLHNLLQLCYSSIPPKYSLVLAQESKVEIKWFREWLMASYDARIAKYPGLPWRSFMRKIVAENYDFASNILKLRHSSEPLPSTDTLIQNFLAGKKKTVCLFPKKWSKVQ